MDGEIDSKTEFDPVAPSLKTGAFSLKEGATGSERVFERFDVVCGTGVGVRDWSGVCVDAGVGVGAWVRVCAGVGIEIGFGDGDGVGIGLGVGVGDDRSGVGVGEDIR